MTRFKKNFKVYFGDTDAAGVVHHARYIYWLEAARIDYLASIGCSYKDIVDSGIGFVPVDISIQYKRPLVFDDDFFIEISVAAQSTASLSIRGDVIKDDVLCCTSVVKLACIDDRSWKPIALPQRLLDCLASAL